LDMTQNTLSKSQSADAMAPRVIVYDEFNGFSLSFNGGIDENRLSIMQNIEKSDALQNESDITTLKVFGLSKTQSFPHRLDILNFNQNTKQFKLSFVDFTQKNLRINTENSCFACHGPTDRPIFSMYPDWPQFYGSDNDELVGYQNQVDFELQHRHQTLELENYKQFKSNITQFPELYTRYSPFYDQVNLKNFFDPLLSNLSENAEGITSNLKDWISYPFRPFNTASPAKSASRAFAFRPGLRFGIVQNRNMSIKIAEDLIFDRTLKSTSTAVEPVKSVFDNFGLYFMYQLIQCVPKEVNKSSQVLGVVLKSNDQPLNILINNRWTSKVAKRLNEVQRIESHLRDQQLSSLNDSQNDLVNLYPDELATIYSIPQYTHNGHLNYKQLWALFQIMVRDIDIRFSRNHSGYSSHLDPSTKLYTQVGKLKPKATNLFEEKIMDIGYIDSYFNSYFDGSATIDELVAAKLYTHFKEKGIINVNLELSGLEKKYAKKFTDRFILDKDFFQRMDQLGLWLPIPYPSEKISSVFENQHRETYKNEFAIQHNQLCLELANTLLPQDPPH